MAMVPYCLLLPLLPAVLAVKHDPPVQLINTIIVTKERPLAFDTQLVTSSSWSSGRLAPHRETSLVACASTCSRRNRDSPGSCTALMYGKETKECHLGTALLAEEGEVGEEVYVMKGAGGEWTLAGLAGLQGTSGRSYELFHLLLELCCCQMTIPYASNSPGHEQISFEALIPNFEDIFFLSSSDRPTGPIRSNSRKVCVSVCPSV